MEPLTPVMRENFWFWDGQLPKKVCKQIISDAEAIGFNDGTIGGQQGGITDKKIRDSGVCWLPRMHLAECILAHYALEANYSSKWNFDLRLVIEKVQIAKYDAKAADQEGQFYDQHLDLSQYLTTPPLERKMSVVLFLSDPADFEGGDLIIMKQTIPKKQGTIVVFPSFMPHQVTPVTKGVRYSAVCWVAGSTFK